VKSVALVAAIAARVVWVAWSYYFRSAPRYPLETAAISLIAVGLILVLLRRGGIATAARRDAVSIAALPVFIVAALALYAPSLRLGLLSDDFVLRAAARAGSSIMGTDGFFRPLPLAVWRALLAGDSPVFLHVLNIALHGLNAGLVGQLGVRLGLSTAAALAAAALFVTFPAAPEAVAWASGIQDVLMTSAVLGAAVFAAGDVGARQFVAMAGLFVAALATKETAICFPILALICRMTVARARQLREWTAFGGLTAIAAIYVVLRASAGIRSEFFSEPSRFLFKHIAVTAFGSLAVPWRSPSSPAASWLAFLTTVSLTALMTAALAIWRRDDVSFVRGVRLTLWIILAVAPVYTYFYVNTQLEGARYLYLAECGWAPLVVDLVWIVTDAAPGRAITRGLIVCAAIVVSAATLHRELSVWVRAADLRDRVLADARLSLEGAGCRGAEFTAVPDSVDGAYVFRNGFREALDLPRDAEAPPDRCRFEWRGNGFVPAR
jgi:hypothetical protein